MLIDEIVSFCNSQYSHADTEHICESCQHEECPQSCKKCLEEIHYPYRYPNGKKEYDCCNLIYFYMSDYNYKYADLMERQLLYGGLRLAKILNDIL